METALLQSPLFRGLTPQQAQQALHCLGAAGRRFDTGEVLLQAGRPTALAGLLAEGRVHILRQDAWGDQSLVHTVEPGGLFGESYACLPGTPLAVSAVAAAPCRALFFRVDRLLKGAEQSCTLGPALAANLMAVLAGKNLALNRTLDHLAQRSTRKKLMAYLSWEAQRQRAREFTIPLSRQQLADYLAVDRSALSAEMSRMRADGLIQYKKNRFCLLAGQE